jgi:hypothetical protein
VSRARRRARHRRPHRAVTVAAPLALGGAVAAVALTASPLGDALRGGSPDAGQDRAGSHGSPDVVMVEPVGGGTASTAPQTTSAGGPARKQADPAGTGQRQAGGSTEPSAQQVSPRAAQQQPSGGGQPSTGPSSPPPSAPQPSTPSPSAPPGGLLPVPLPTPTATVAPSLPIVPLPVLPSLPTAPQLPVLP